MVSKAGLVAVGFAVFYGMAWVARFWNGDLKPNLLWLATASVTTIALYLGRPRQWWLIAGSTLAGIATGYLLFQDSLPGMLGPIAGNTFEIAAISLAVPLVLGPAISIRTAADGFAVLAVVAGAVAIGGAIAIVGDASSIINAPRESWARWVVGNMLGELLILPLVLFRNTAVISRRDEKFPVEMLITLGLIAGTAIVTITTDSWLVYLIIPLILWLAIRYGPFVAAPVAVVTAVSVSAATGQGHGPFVEFASDPVLQSQLFKLSLAACVLIGGAHSVRAWNDQKHLSAVLAAMPDMIFVRRREGGELVSSYVPEGMEERAEAVEPAVSTVSPTLDDVPPTPGDPSLIYADAATFERRTVPVDDERDLDLVRDVTVEQEAIRELDRRRDAVEQARVAEQRRLGRALHDSPVQLLAAALIRLDTAQKDPSAADTSIVQAEELTRQAMHELREKLDELMPPDIGAGDVIEALEQLARLLLPDDVEIVTASDAAARPAPPDVNEILFLVGREAVSNVAIHAGAGRIELRLETDDDSVVLTVVDDGTGLPRPTLRHRGVGLGLMRQRVAERGGTIRFTNGDDGGTTVTVTLPLRG